MPLWATHNNTYIPLLIRRKTIKQQNQRKKGDLLFFHKKIEGSVGSEGNQPTLSTSMSTPRRSARIAAKNAPSTPVKSRSMRETPSAPIKENRIQPVVRLQSTYDAPDIVAARLAAAALYPVGSKEYYDELDKSPAIQADRAAFFNRFSGSISKGW